MRFLRMKLTVEATTSGDADRVRALMPRVLDSFQMYLRTLAPEELQGSAGLYRLKEDLMIRVHNATEEAQLRDILVKEMLVQ
jgi:flagellar FliL protein